MSNDVFSQISPQVRQLVKHYDQQLKMQALAVSQGAQTSVNWYEVFTKFVASVTNVVSTVAASPGDRRQAVIVAAISFWQQSVSPFVSGKIGMPWVYDSFIAPAIEREIPSIAGGMYDAILAVVNRLAGQPSPAPVPEPAGQVGSSVPGDFQPY